VEDGMGRDLALVGVSGLMTDGRSKEVHCVRTRPPCAIPSTFWSSRKSWCS